MPIADAVLRSLRSEFERFNAAHGRIGAVLFCELLPPLADVVDGGLPPELVSHFDLSELPTPAEFPCRQDKPNRTAADIHRDIHSVDGRMVTTFAAGPVSSGSVSLLPCKADDTPDADSVAGAFATGDGRLLIPLEFGKKGQPVWCLTGARFELRYFVQGPPAAWVNYRKLETAAAKSLCSAVEPERLIRWASPTVVPTVQKIVDSNFWTESLFWIGGKSEVSMPFLADRRILAADVPSPLHRRWSTLPQRDRNSQPMPVEAVPSNWYVVLTDAAAASVLAIDVILAALPEIGRSAEPSPVAVQVAETRNADLEDDRLERICDFLRSPLQVRIVRYLWGRQFSADLDAFREVCWQGKDVQDESVERQCQRIGELMAGELSICVSLANRRVSMEVFGRDSGK